MRAGMPDPALFPAAAWRGRVADAIAADHCPQYSDPAGLRRLRQAIAHWISRSRSVIADEDAVVITCGSQHAIDLVVRVLIEPGECAVVEEPGYVPVARLLRSLGAHVVCVPVDSQGLIIDQLPPSARIVYVTPSHQFPLGMTMSMQRRQALLRWAQRHDAAIIEDDYDTEFRYVDRPLEPIQLLDENGRVVYVGSFSKTFSPSVRLGFAVVPRLLVSPIAALRQLIDWHPPTATQMALASFIEDGLLDKHIRRSRRVYNERRQLIGTALSGPLAADLTPLAASAGLHVAAVLREGLSEASVLAAAGAHGIATTGLSGHYDSRPGQQGLVMGFGAIPTADLPGALQALAGALRSAQ
jgi:GntR family transcriptional regulator/MocR family aminotransferase